MSAADSKACSPGGWRDKLARFHRTGRKVDYYGGRYDPHILRTALDILQGGDALVFPAKTYIVAICYADYIARQYGEDLYTVLADPHLLYDDHHFQPYGADTAILYDTLLPLVLSEEFKAGELYQAILGYCRAELEQE